MKMKLNQYRNGYFDADKKRNKQTKNTVGSLNGIYGIKSPFPAPTGSATDSTGILLMKLTMNATSAKDFYLEKN